MRKNVRETDCVCVCARERHTQRERKYQKLRVRVKENLEDKINKIQNMCR